MPWGCGWIERKVIRVLCSFRPGVKKVLNFTRELKWELTTKGLRRGQEDPLGSAEGHAAGPERHVNTLKPGGGKGNWRRMREQMNWAGTK